MSGADVATLVGADHRQKLEKSIPTTVFEARSGEAGELHTRHPSRESSLGPSPETASRTRIQHMARTADTARLNNPSHVTCHAIPLCRWVKFRLFSPDF
jgi:hypothetical protein